MDVRKNLSDGAKYFRGEKNLKLMARGLTKGTFGSIFITKIEPQNGQGPSMKYVTLKGEGSKSM